MDGEQIYLAKASCEFEIFFEVVVFVEVMNRFFAPHLKCYFVCNVLFY